MKLRFSRAANADLEKIGEWIARDNPCRAAEFVVELEQTCQRLVDFPSGGEIVGRYRKEAVRRKLHGEYLVLYTIRQDTIFIVRVIHGAQDYLRFLD